MAIELRKILVSGGIGLVDLALDIKPQVIGGVNIQDAVRLGGTLGGFAMSMTGFYPDVGETLFVATLPLTIKTVYNMVKGVVTPAGKVVRGAAAHELRVPPPPSRRIQQIEIVGVR